MDQNALSQSDFRILKWPISLEQNDEIACFQACRKKFGRIRSWLKNFDVGMIKNRCHQSGHRTVKLDVFQKQIK